MSTGPLPALINYRKLALENNKLEGTIPLEKFARLVESLESSEGDVQVRVEFRRGSKRKSLIIGTVSVKVMLACQNCLLPVEFGLEASLRHLIVPTEEILLELPEGEHGIISTEEKVSLVELLEDELIINLPMVARHAFEDGVSVCKPVFTHDNDESPINTDTHRPFADWADSLKRDED